jgi:DNA-binding NarL/FixJ family response regulator
VRPVRRSSAAADVGAIEQAAERAVGASGDRTVRVLLVDDHDFFRTGLRALLTEQPDVEVVGEAPDGAGAVELYGRRRPDVVLMDLSMPRMSGTEATAEIKSRWPDARVLMLTVSGEDSAVIDAVRAGASGYLLKESSVEEIVRGIRAVAAGHFLTSPRVAGALVGAAESAATRAESVDAIRATLTEQEFKVLELIAQGRGNAEIGAELFLSPSTVKNYVAAILDKLDVENRVEAAVYAVRSGLA